MSSANSDVSATIAEFASFDVDFCLSISAWTLYVYDYIITFDREVELFWNGKRSGAAAIFILNRYLPLIAQLFYIVEYTLFIVSAERFGHYTEPQRASKRWLTNTSYSCAAFIKTSLVVVILQYFPWALFSALRAHALVRSRMLSTLVLLLSLVAPMLTFAKFAFGQTGVTQDFQPVVPGNCLVTDDLTTGMELHHHRIADMSDLGGHHPGSRDMVNLAKANLQLIFHGTNAPHTSCNVSTYCFVPQLSTNYGVNSIVLTLNVLHMSFSIRSILSSDDISEVTVFSEHITAILVSRFLMDLQEANRKAVDQTSSVVSAPDSLHFVTNFVDSFGASITIPGVGEDYFPELSGADKSAIQDRDGGGSPDPFVGRDHGRDRVGI
ncbi:hypothetical protein L226DRAFT_567173 [Lentinus tigrinus ALCF2SS1-7]|uniref:DUF6533 domain-containing protein n=1 Tax=Lentinus tigrinus ALCF2SS1-6 TaxID=1328759 RepID=A0A5C2SQK5_9APHY|nr:hypothetical protein L227DRAFT_649660 [Lentinus tigrinus ALCF2SS1-6]RPD78976.1 hypothetical protein L226DRAFT_567173 [Lentinus tigrinus ALCF2SS1-7]